MVSGQPSGSKSKHVKIRAFWIQEQIQAGRIKVRFKTSEKMITDGLTKPLQEVRGSDPRQSIGSRGMLEYPWK